MPGERPVNAAVVGDALAAAAFAALGVLSLTRWRRGLGGFWFIPTLFVTAAWGLLTIADRAGIGHIDVELVAVVRLGLWLIVLAKLVPAGSDPLVGIARRGAFLALPVVLLVDAAAAVLGDLGVGNALHGRVQIAGGMLIALLGLVLVEQAIRNAPAADKWALKYILLGAGALLAFDLVYYANAYLRLDVAEALSGARGGVGCFAALVLAIGLRRLSQHRLAPPASQGIAFYTGSLIAIGSYLVVAAFAAFYVRVVGGTEGVVLEALVITGALVVLVALLISEQVRAWARVIIAKGLSPYRYDYREEWLRLTESLSGDDESEPLPERALRAVTRIVHSPSGGLWTRHGHNEYIPVAGSIATAASHTAVAGAAWLRFLETEEWVLDLSATLPAKIAHEGIPAWLSENAAAWLVVPLLSSGSLEGFVVVAKPLTPSGVLTWEDLDLLRTTGRQVAAFLALERVAEGLAQARQFEAYNRVATFMMHDLKNLAAQLSLVVRNAEKHRHNPDFIEDVIATVDNAARRMQHVLDQLGSGGESPAKNRVDVAIVCRDVVARCADRTPRPELIAPAAPLEVAVNSVGLVHVLEHVVRNAQDASSASDRIVVTARESGADIVIEVSDTGCGMDASFVRDRLFRPFDSTRGSYGMGIGAFQAREFALGAGGSVEVKSVPGAGTEFRILLPRASVT